jgi:hypothetical protein
MMGFAGHGGPFERAALFRAIVLDVGRETAIRYSLSGSNQCFVEKCEGFMRS